MFSSRIAVDFRQAYTGAAGLNIEVFPDRTGLRLTGLGTNIGLGYPTDISPMPLPLPLSLPQPVKSVELQVGRVSAPPSRCLTEADSSISRDVSSPPSMCC
jgi:hypothetical protein